MSENNAKEELKILNANLGNLYKAQPDLMGAFNSVISEASKEGTLSPKIKELMAIAISIAMRCEGCVIFHLNKALKFGVTREEVAETISVAIEMGGGPSSVYGAKALMILTNRLNTLRTH